MYIFRAHDTINDVAIIQTTFGLTVRYGLQSTKCQDMESALQEFHACQSHAMRSEGLLPDYEEEYS